MFITSSASGRIRLGFGWRSARRQSNVRWLVLREIAMIVLAGIAIGVPATLAGGHLVTHMLFGLKDNDPASRVGGRRRVASCGDSGRVYFPPWAASQVDPDRGVEVRVGTKRREHEQSGKDNEKQQCRTSTRSSCSVSA